MMKKGRKVLTFGGTFFLMLVMCLGSTACGGPSDESIKGYYTFECSILYQDDQLVRSSSTDTVGISFFITDHEIISIGEEFLNRMEYVRSGNALVFEISAAEGYAYDAYTVEDNTLSIILGPYGNEKLVYVYRKQFGVPKDGPQGRYHIESLAIRGEDENTIFETTTPMTPDQIERYGCSNRVGIEIDDFEFRTYLYGDDKTRVDSYFYQAVSVQIRFIRSDINELILFDQERVYFVFEDQNSEMGKQWIVYTFLKD